jgi:hypothetical protein
VRREGAGAARYAGKTNVLGTSRLQCVQTIAASWMSPAQYRHLVISPPRFVGRPGPDYLTNARGSWAQGRYRTGCSHGAGVLVRPRGHHQKRVRVACSGAPAWARYDAIVLQTWFLLHCYLRIVTRPAGPRRSLHRVPSIRRGFSIRAERMIVSPRFFWGGLTIHTVS